MELDYPFHGRCLVQNSPANRIPSHGTDRFGTTFAIDFVPVDQKNRSARFSARSLWRPEAPEKFIGFGQPVVSPVAGTVVLTHDGSEDHDAYRGFPSVGYARTQARRVAGGWGVLAGNYVVIQELQSGHYVALCHLRRGSVRVRIGQNIQIGAQVAEFGNSGNSTEPHVHVQAVDALDFVRAVGLPLSFPSGLPRNGQIVDGRPPDSGQDAVQPPSIV
ncbi:M23 family metallopeptidase [Kocuria sp. cx-116]|uniref:M23 family metallopeptidase n=1 Tax=Kocuria sp. cx-116 TaxID=2771378 RepID=UPI002A4E29F3|nr:M23 family metallopeptidase [Kocuria sp. cx-116]